MSDPLIGGVMPKSRAIELLRKIVDELEKMDNELFGDALPLMRHTFRHRDTNAGIVLVVGVEDPDDDDT